MPELDFENWTCPLPLRDYPNVILGHGGGGKLSAELVENIFVPAFDNRTLDNLGDSAVLDFSRVLAESNGRLAFSTDSYVVQPLFFRGGCIGDLAVNGTVNDLAMSGARPLVLSAGFIIEEGLPMATLGKIVAAMSAAAKKANVQIVTGDTKVVERGKGDGIFINTSGIGVVPNGVNIAANKAQPGDVVIISGEIGLHGVAIMSERENLEFEAAIESDCAPLHDLVAEMLAVTNEIHVLRDPTRGGVATSLNEIADAANVGIRIYENRLPIPVLVKSACEILGLDPLYVANEGKLLAILPKIHAENILAKMRRHEFGRDAVIIGEVTNEHRQMVVAETIIGATRVVDVPLGEQLPRIC